MKVLGIIGSPNRQGMTWQLVSTALEGALAAGATVDVLYAHDHSVEYCHDCKGKTCWTDQACRFDKDWLAVNNTISECDALVVGVPVYFLAPNGLSRLLLDKVRTNGRTDGLPALGLSIAGGSGKGAVLAVRSLNDFFCCHGMRALESVPATRFNFTGALEAAKERGASLLQTPRVAFADMAERLLYYSELKFARWDMLDEHYWLAKEILRHTEPVQANRDTLALAGKQLALAEEQLQAGNKSAAAKPLVAACEAAVAAWHTAHI